MYLEQKNVLIISMLCVITKSDSHICLRPESEHNSVYVNIVSTQQAPKIPFKWKSGCSAREKWVARGEQALKIMFKPA